VSESGSRDGAVGVLICDDVAAMRLLLGVVVDLKEGLRVIGEAEDGVQAISRPSASSRT
jgi:hypothetical protein